MRDIFETQEIRAHITKDEKSFQKINQKLKKLYVKFAKDTADPRWQFFTEFEDWIKDRYDDRESWFEDFCRDYHVEGKQHFDDQVLLIAEAYEKEMIEQNTLRKNKEIRKLHKYMRKTGKLCF